MGGTKKRKTTTVMLQNNLNLKLGSKNFRKPFLGRKISGGGRRAVEGYDRWSPYKSHLIWDPTCTLVILRGSTYRGRGGKGGMGSEWGGEEPLAKRTRVPSQKSQEKSFGNRKGISAGGL